MLVDPRPEMHEKYGHLVADVLYCAKVVKLCTELTEDTKDKVYEVMILCHSISMTLDEFKHEIDEIKIEGFPMWSEFCKLSKDTIYRIIDMI